MVRFSLRFGLWWVIILRTKRNSVAADYYRETHGTVPSSAIWFMPDGSRLCHLGLFLCRWSRRLGNLMPNGIHFDANIMHWPLSHQNLRLYPLHVCLFLKLGLVISLDEGPATQILDLTSVFFRGHEIFGSLLTPTRFWYYRGSVGRATRMTVSIATPRVGMSKMRRYSDHGNIFKWCGRWKSGAIA